MAQRNPDRHWVLAGPAELFWIWWRDLVPSIAAPTFATMGFGVPKISRINSSTRPPVMGSTSRCIPLASTKKTRILPGSVNCQAQGLQTGGRQPRRQARCVPQPRLQGDFLCALADDFAEHGKAAIARMREQSSAHLGRQRHYGRHRRRNSLPHCHRQRVGSRYCGHRVHRCVSASASGSYLLTVV